MSDLTAGDPATDRARAGRNSLWRRLSARRLAFFARHEKFFLWALSIPLLLCGLALLVFFVLWVAEQGGSLEAILGRRWVP